MSLGLLAASFRGVPFAVTDQSTSIGRRLAVHEYVGSEAVWTEDLGRGATRYRLRGFILENDLVYDGGPIKAQRALLVAAAKAAGSSILTHPTLGILSVSCESCSIGEGLDGATYSTIEWSFVEAGAQSFPSLSLDSLAIPGAVVAAVALAADAVRIIAAPAGASAALPAVSAQWTAQVSAAAADATALSRLAAALPGNLGRYSRGATNGYLTAIGASTTTAVSIGELVALAAAQRAGIAAAVTAVEATIAGLTVSTTQADYADAVGALLGSLSAACADPADALRLLEQLLGFQPTGVDAASAAGAAAMALWQRQLALAIVSAAASYQAQSYDDAFAVMVRVTGVLDGAITAAGDTGQDSLFTALRALRATIVQDFRARGAALTHVRTFVLPGPMPAVALAQRLYRDAGRSDELVREAGTTCVSPLFMPATIQALAT